MCRIDNRYILFTKSISPLIIIILLVLNLQNVFNPPKTEQVRPIAYQNVSRSKSTYKKVSFVVGGVQKGGTTALFEYLEKHPYLSLSVVKEVHFFDDESIDWKAPNYAKYDSPRYFQKKTDIRGEATPIYIYWLNSMKRIQAYNPEMKLIFIFRQPVQRAWSQWKMFTERGVEKKSFSWSIRDGLQKREENLKVSVYNRVFNYVDRGFYGQQLERVLEYFPRHQLLLLLSEDLRADPTETIRKVSQFLQVPAPTEKIKKLTANVASNSSSTDVLKKEDAIYLQNLYNDDLKLFAKLSGLNITSWFS